ncbi:MAG: J domain-containing protein [Candidatus Methanosuratincola sp.]
MDGAPSGTTTFSAQETIALRLKDNQQKLDACMLYLNGQRSLARKLMPEYIDGIEKQKAYKTDFLFGVAFFVAVTLLLVYYVIPMIESPQAAIGSLFAGVFATFFLIEHATRRVRAFRIENYLESKELPRLKKEIDVQKSSIQTLLVEEKKRREKEERLKWEKEQAKKQREHEERRRKEKRDDEERRRRQEWEQQLDSESFGEKSYSRFTRSSGKMTLEEACMILDVSPGAGKAEIQKAYREAIIQYHPDRVAHLADEFKALAEERSKLINEAYELLKANLKE